MKWLYYTLYIQYESRIYAGIGFPVAWAGKPMPLVIDSQYIFIAIKYRKIFDLLRLTMLAYLHNDSLGR